MGPAILAGCGVVHRWRRRRSSCFEGELGIIQMILLKAAHPPSGATTLIISLGIVTRPMYLLVIELAVVLLALQAIVINRVAGLDYPAWAKRS